MSVINRMLQDLERRRADAPATGAGLGVHAVDAHGQTPWLPRVLIVFLIVAAAISAWWFFGTRQPVTSAANPESTRRSGSDSTPVHIVTPRSASAVPPNTSPASQTASSPAGVPLPAQGPPAAQLPRVTTQATSVASAPTAPASRPADGQAHTAFVPREGARAQTAMVPERPATASEPPVPAPERRLDAAQPQVLKQVSTSQRAEAAYQQALQLLQHERNSDAERALNEALRLDPSHVLARQALIGLLVEQKRLMDAEAMLRDGLAINPAQRGFAMALARLQAERGDTQAALMTLRQSLPYSGDSADYRAFLAALYQRVGNSKDAIRQYEAALKLAPNNGAWWMGMGLSLEADGQNAAAQDAFQRALATHTLSAELQAFVSQRLQQLR